MATSEDTRLLSEQQLVEMTELMGDADSVELKATIPATDQRATVDALGLDPLEAQIRQVFFFDTPDLTLYESGVVVRARRVQGKTDDTVVKLRPVEPTALSKKLRRTPAFGVEVDAMPGGFVCSGSMKGVVRKLAVREALTAGHPIRKLFTKEQRAFYADRAPEGLALDDLAVLGPIFVLKLNTTPKGYGRKLTSEMWLYPDGSRILELSTKCPPADAFDVAAQTRAFLAGKGIELGGEQQTKTKTALQY